MIYSVSRYTEVPYFFMDKFYKMLEDQTVEFNFTELDQDGKKVERLSRISLDPREVTALFLWSKNWENYIPYAEYIEKNYRVIYQHSAPLLPNAISNNKFFSSVDEEILHLADAVEFFRNRLVWRLEPIIFTSLTPQEYWLDMVSKVLNLTAHPDGFNKINRVVFSLYEPTDHSEPRMTQRLLSRANINNIPLSFRQAGEFFNKLSKIFEQHKVEFESCRNPFLVSNSYMKAAKCIDNELVKKVIHSRNDLPSAALYPDDPHPPEGFTNCNCVQHIDLGFLFNDCPGACTYCSERITGYGQ